MRRGHCPDFVRLRLTARAASRRLPLALAPPRQPLLEAGRVAGDLIPGRLRGDPDVPGDAEARVVVEEPGGHPVGLGARQLLRERRAARAAECRAPARRLREHLALLLAGEPA